MIKYPNIDPNIISIGSFSVKWYGAMYVIAFIFGLYWVNKWFKDKNSPQGMKEKDKVWDLGFVAMLGVILGGRLGYTFFYNFSNTINDPTSIIKVWEGGMSFHGGLIGVILAIIYFAWKNKVSFLYIGDIIAIPAALGVSLVRIGNFINGELYGRPTDVSWCMKFPTDLSNLCRHPSQLYQFLLEGFLLFIILVILKNKRLKTGVVSYTFALGYGFLRILVEFVRTPEIVYFGWLTQGMTLSIPMILFGGWGLWSLRGELD